MYITLTLVSMIGLPESVWTMATRVPTQLMTIVAHVYSLRYGAPVLGSILDAVPWMQ